MTNGNGSACEAARATSLPRLLSTPLETQPPYRRTRTDVPTADALTVRSIKRIRTWRSSDSLMVRGNRLSKSTSINAMRGVSADVSVGRRVSTATADVMAPYP